MLQQLTSPDFRVEIFPSGLRVERQGRADVEPPAGVERGEITQFSHAAARRLREWFMTMHVIGWYLFAVTLTTHAIYGPDQWRAICQRFRQSLIRIGFAGVWRVELQRRKAPHLHVACWLPYPEAINELRALWLRATGEANDSAAAEHAMHFKAISPDEAGWAVYMGLHDGKHKAEQLGWIGKQWGIWNRGKFVQRAPVIFDLSTREHGAFLRFLRRLEAGNRRKAASDAWAFLTESSCMDSEILTRAWRKFKALKKARRVRLHGGNLLRLMRGETAALLLNAMRSGVICHISHVPAR